AIANGIEKLVGMPARGQRARLRFAVPDHATDHQVRIVEGGAVSVRNRVAQFAALVNGAGSLGRDVAGHASRKRELLEQSLHAFGVLGDVGVELAVRALERSEEHTSELQS